MSGEFIGVMHECDLPEATEEVWVDKRVWECSTCDKVWYVTRESEFAGYRSAKITYTWKEYYGHVTRQLNPLRNAANDDEIPEP